MWRDCLINCLVGRIPIPVINHSAALQLFCRDLQNCIVIPAAPVYLQARVQVLVKGITAGAAVCFRESHPPLLSNFLDSPDTWRTGRCGEKLSHSDRELHLADLLPLPLLYENGLSEQLVRQKCLPASQCGWYCDPPPVHAEPGSKWGGGRGQFHLLPKPLSSCLFCLSVWADFSSYSTCKILTFVFRLPFFFFFLRSAFSHRVEGDMWGTHLWGVCVFIYLFILGTENACQGGACHCWAEQEGEGFCCLRRFSVLGGWLETSCVTMHKKDSHHNAKFQSPTPVPPEELRTLLRSF